MPLKHVTETVLLLVLAVVTVVTGVLVSVLPPLPAGWMPWSVLSILTLAYPIALYAFFRRNRADYLFRLLHFLPFVFTLLWLTFQLLSQSAPRMSGMFSALTWGHMAGPILASLTLLALYCLNVIRRRVPRLLGLGVLTALFAAFVGLSQDRGWGTQLATVVGGRTASVAGSAQSSGKNLAFSSIPAEEEWRQKLRDVENKSSSSSARPASAPSSAVSGVASAGAIRSSASSRPAIVAIVPPNRLPTSGFGAESIATLFIAGYCGVVHARAKRRFS